MGIYRHYKGALFQVIGLAHDANADTLAPTDNHGSPIGFALGERTVVVYFDLQYDDAELTAPIRVKLFVRTPEDFTAVVHDDGTPCDGTHCLHGENQVARFVYLGPELTAEMVT